MPALVRQRTKIMNNKMKARYGAMNSADFQNEHVLLYTHYVRKSYFQNFDANGKFHIR